MEIDLGGEPEPCSLNARRGARTCMVSQARFFLWALSLPLVLATLGRPDKLQRVFPQLGIQPTSKLQSAQHSGK